MGTGFWSPVVFAFVIGLVSEYAVAKEPVAIQVTASGASVVQGTTYATPEELKRVLVELKADAVRIRPDRDAQYADVARVMKVIQELGITDLGLVGGESSK
jgi:biopolymer transport protein ExbD